MEPSRRRPSPETLAWVARAVSPTARVVGWRRLTGGGPQASVHRVKRDSGRARHHLVLRQWLPPSKRLGAPSPVRGMNLAVLFSPGLSEEFRRVDESEAGRKVDASWDLAAMLSFDQGWHEDLLAAAVARL